MVSTAEYANLSLYVYELCKRCQSKQDRPSTGDAVRIKALERWWIQDWLADAASGFYGAIFSRKGESVVAYAGTNDLRGDIVADLSIAVGLLPTFQLAPALKLYRIAASQTRNRVTITGHSLGGALTQVIAYVNTTQGITFDAPGMANQLDVVVKILKLFKVEFPSTDWANRNIVNYRDRWDAVSGLGIHTNHIGRVVTVDTGKKFYDILGSHSIESLRDYFEKNWGNAGPFG